MNEYAFIGHNNKKEVFYMLKLKNDAIYDVVGLGEVMLRLSAPGKELLAQSDIFEKNAGGSELNVVSGVTMLGGKGAIITKIPESKAGSYICSKIRMGNVDDKYVIFDSEPDKRLGIYYYENGAYPRKASVIYDRVASSMCSLVPEEINPDIYKQAKIFHLSSITLAIKDGFNQVVREITKSFKNAGALISFDVNYRASMWSEEKAKRVIEEFLPLADVLFVSEETSRRMLGRRGTVEEIVRGYAENYGSRIVAVTQREVISPSKHNFNSQIAFDGEIYREEGYNDIEVVDRIGSGDAYVAGVLFGLVKHGSITAALEIGNAMAAVKNTIPGDMSTVTFNELEAVINAHKNIGADSEMNR